MVDNVQAHKIAVVVSFYLLLVTVVMSLATWPDNMTAFTFYTSILIFAIGLVGWLSAWDSSRETGRSTAHQETGK